MIWGYRPIMFLQQLTQIFYENKKRIPVFIYIRKSPQPFESIPLISKNNTNTNYYRGTTQFVARFYNWRKYPRFLISRLIMTTRERTNIPVIV